MSLRPKPEIENLHVSPHGGMDYAELRAAGIDPAAVLDFSVCTNPFMPPAGTRKILSDVVIDQYPDSAATELRDKLSARLDVPADNILAGSGTTELIRLIALAYFRQGDSALILEPTYGEYEVACRIAGVEPLKLRAREEDNFVPGIAEAVNLIQRHHPRAVFICNPNNPTGRYLPRRDIEPILKALPDGLLILDEAYLAFVEQGWQSVDLLSQGNVVILRSMTKDYGLAGLRLGYAIANQEIIGNLRRVCPPWNVNAVAQKMGAASLDYTDYLEKTKPKVAAAKQLLIDSLSRTGMEIVPSDTNFFLVKVGDARAFRTALLRHGILVRDCASFGLPQYVRIAPRTLPECRRLITAIDTVVRSR